MRRAAVSPLIVSALRPALTVGSHRTETEIGPFTNKAGYAVPEPATLKNTNWRPCYVHERRQYASWPEIYRLWFNGDAAFRGLIAPSDPVHRAEHPSLTNP